MGSFVKQQWELIPFEEAVRKSTKGSNVYHAAHCLIWCKLQVPIIGLDRGDLHPRAAVLMHIRFDGKIGFPGGEVDDSLEGVPLQAAQQIVTDGLNRELREELNHDCSKHPIKFADYLFTHTPAAGTTIRGRQFFAHFFTHELSLEELQSLEVRSLSSREHGREVAGNFRVPLYTTTNGTGLPAFLDNNFIGNARDQLTSGLVSLKLLTQAEVDEATSLRKLTH